jgi:hypothetical protein
MARRFEVKDEAGRAVMIERPCWTTRLNTKLISAVLTIALIILGLAVTGLRGLMKQNDKLSAVEKEITTRVPYSTFTAVQRDNDETHRELREIQAGAELRSMESLGRIMKEQERLAGEQRTTNEILARLEKKLDDQ